MVAVRQTVVQNKRRQSGQRGPSKVPVRSIPTQEERKLRPTEVLSSKASFRVGFFLYLYLTQKRTPRRKVQDVHLV